MNKQTPFVVLSDAHALPQKEDDIRLFRANDDRPASENLEAHIGSCRSYDSPSG